MGDSRDVTFVCTRDLRLQGFFGSTIQHKTVSVYEFRVSLERGGEGYRVRSHELPSGSCNISTMLIGRGTLATHDWGLRVDGAGQPYIPVGTGKSYMVEMGKDYQLQQEECAWRCAG